MVEKLFFVEVSQSGRVTVHKLKIPHSLAIKMNFNFVNGNF